jgi:ribosomal protein L40E
MPAARVKIGRMAMTRHCWKCGAEYPQLRSPGRSESCSRCRSDLKVCLNCVSYDPHVARQCRDRRADPVAEKHLANYCEYFEFVRREFVPPTEDRSREAKARETLQKLLGD